MGRQSVFIPGQIIPLDFLEPENNILTLGRDPYSDIEMPFDGVSWQHARIIKLGPGEYYIEDLNSSNGTWLVEIKGSKHGIRTREKNELLPNKPYKLGSGDRLIFGTVELTFTFNEVLESSGQMYLCEILQEQLTKSYKGAPASPLATNEGAAAKPWDGILNKLVKEISAFPVLKKVLSMKQKSRK